MTFDGLPRGLLKKRYVLFFGSLSVLVIGAIGIWKIVGESKLNNAGLIIEEQMDSDLKILASAEQDAPSEAMLSGALIRLAKIGHPLALKESLKRYQHTSPMIRLSCANALGFFETKESLRALQELTNDAERRVKIQAVRALAFRRSPGRQEMLANILQNSSLIDEEKQAVHLSLGEIASDPKIKENSIQQLIKYGKNNFDPNLAIQATIHVISLAPKHPDVLELLKRTLREGDHPVIQAIAVRHLSNFRDPWLKQSIELVRNNRSADVRQALVQSIHLLCPEDRWILIEKILREEEDPNVRKKTIEEISAMPGKPAQELLQKTLLKEYKLLREPSETFVVRQIQDGILKLAKDDFKDPCDHENPSSTHSAIRSPNSPKLFDDKP